MTTVNLAVQGRKGYVYTDTAVTAPDGTLLGTTGKLIVGTGKLPWAIGVSGNVMPTVLCEEICKTNPLNARRLRAALPGCLRTVVNAASTERCTDVSNILVQVSGAVWNAEEKRVEGFFVTSARGTMIGQDPDPYTYYEQSWSASCAHPDGLRGYFGREVDLTDPASFDPIPDGRTLMEAQRLDAIVNVTPGAEVAACRIGGEAHVAIVSKRGVIPMAIIEWDDPVGERINADREYAQ